MVSTVPGALTRALSMVSGSGQASPHAIVILAEDLRGNMLDSAVTTRVENEMAQLLKKVNAALTSYEQLHMIVISKEAWSIENGFLTPTMKIKRSRIEAAVADKIETWYQSGEAIIWH